MNKDISKKTLNDSGHLTTLKIISALRHGFNLNRSLELSICSDQRCNNIDHAMQKWLRSFLLMPDKQAGSLLMPLVAQRFNDYVNKLTRNNLL